ncbi:hypothetical protein D3C72_988550 [compost metagenome]
MAIRIVKQPHVVFYVQHVTGGVIQLRHRDFAGFHQVWQVFAVVLVAHAHVDPGFERHAHRVFRIGGGTVFNQLFNRAVIGNGNTLKAPLVAQHIFQQPGIGGRRGAVEGVQGHHHRAAARVKPGFVRRHVVVEQALRTHIDGVVLFSALHCTVGSEVFNAGHH